MESIAAGRGTWDDLVGAEAGSALSLWPLHPPAMVAKKGINTNNISEGRNLIMILGTGFDSFDETNFMDKQDSINKDDINATITPMEKAMLDQAGSNNTSLNDDDARLTASQLDNTDNEGALLNEESSADDASGADLDVPGASADDADEAIGEEDEENNSYSEADTE